MKLGFAATALVAVAFSASAALAAPTGTYRVEGHNPGGGDAYTGTVTVHQTGQTYKVVWKVGGDTFVGTGLGGDNFLAVSYKTEGKAGLALYAKTGTGEWQGVWTVEGSQEAGTENWSH